MAEENYSIQGTPLLEEAIAVGKTYINKEDQSYTGDYAMIGLLYVCNMDLSHLTDFNALHSTRARVKWPIGGLLQEAIEEQKDLRLRFGEAGEKRGSAAIFLLAGPPGVGKTFLATKMAELCNYESLVLDMSGYSHGKDSIESLTGFDSTYKDSHEGALTGFVDQNPESVVVFDDKDFRSASKDYRRTDGQPLGEWLEILGEEWTERNEKHLGFIRAEEYRKGVPKQQTEEEKDRREREWELLAEVLSGDHKAGEEGYYFPEDLKDRAPNMSLYGVEIYGLVNKSQWTKRLRELKPEEQK